MDLEILARVGKLLTDLRSFERSLNHQQRQCLRRLMYEIRVIIAEIITAYEKGGMEHGDANKR